MSGIRNEIVYANNVDFSGATVPTAQVTTDGQLLIGATATPNIRVNTLTAGSGISITNGPGAITIASSAPIPVTSAFFAYLNTSVLAVTGDGTVYTVIFEATTYNDGNNYSTTTGIYTAPVTGTYVFFSSVGMHNLSAAAGHDADLIFNINSVPILFNYGNTVYASTTGPGDFSFQGSSIVRMTAGQTISVQVSVGNQGKTVDIDGLSGGGGIFRSVFSGFLLSTAGAATPTTYVADTGSAVPAANTLNVLGGVGCSTTGAGNTLTINASGLGLDWHAISVNTTLVVNSGYFCTTPGGALQLALPAASALGDTIKVSLNGATSFQIVQGGGQQIRIGNKTTTLGAGGSLTTTAQGDSIEIVCQTANTIWVAQHVEGNFTVV